MTDTTANASRSRAAQGMRAVILAGGKGTRLAPFTVTFPKPLVPLGDRPVLDILIERLAAHEITNITLTLGHLAELIKAYFTQHRELNRRVNIDFVEESQPTGTAGSLAHVPNLTSTFLVMNGDLLTNLNLHDLVEFHRREKAQLTIATARRTLKVDLGVLDVDAAHRVVGYHEKPVHTYLASMGIYVYEPEVLAEIRPGEYLDFPQLVLRSIEKGLKVCSYTTDCVWLDIGRPDDYAEAQQLFQANRDLFLQA